MLPKPFAVHDVLWLDVPMDDVQLSHDFQAVEQFLLDPFGLDLFVLFSVLIGRVEALFHADVDRIGIGDHVEPHCIWTHGSEFEHTA